MNRMKKLLYIQYAEAACGLCLLVFSACVKNTAGIIVSALISIVSIVMIVLLGKEERISLYMKAQLKKKDHRMRTEENNDVMALRKALDRAEYTSLQSQINPHFLYNTLDSIRSKALLEGQGDIADMAEKLAVFFRYCISNREHLVKIREELKHIDDYYHIQKFRFGDRFEMNISVENDEIADFYIPRMTLQPIVENALHHGIEKSTRKGLIDIRIIENGHDVEITISDNGAGMDLADLRRLNENMENMSETRTGRHNGIAVSNINRRIRMTFGEEYGIHYRSMKDAGTDAVITLPAVDDFSRSAYDLRKEES